jgi:hypothetical protein
MHKRFDHPSVDSTVTGIKNGFEVDVKDENGK